MAKSLSQTLKSRLSKAGVQPLHDAPPANFISSGSFLLDWIMAGGIPRGYLTYMRGEKHSGKTWTALLAARHIALNAEKMTNGGKVAYFDVEGGVNQKVYNLFGLNPEQFHLYGPATGENILDMAHASILDNDYDLIVIDSVAAVAYQAQLEGNMNDNHWAIGARKWSQFCNTVVYQSLRKSNTALLVTNQVRAQMDPYKSEFDSDPGGRQIVEHAPSIKLTFLKPDKKQADAIGLRPKTIKNRFGELRNAKGSLQVKVRTDTPTPIIDTPGEMTFLGTQLGVFTGRDDERKIKADGTWYIAGGWFFQGDSTDCGSEQAVIDRMYADVEFRYSVEDAVTQAIQADSQKPLVIRNVDENTGEVADEE